MPDFFGLPWDETAGLGWVYDFEYDAYCWDQILLDYEHDVGHDYLSVGSDLFLSYEQCYFYFTHAHTHTEGDWGTGRGGIREDMGVACRPIPCYAHKQEWSKTDTIEPIPAKLVIFVEEMKKIGVKPDMEMHLEETKRGRAVWGMAVDSPGSPSI